MFALACSCAEACSKPQGGSDQAIPSLPVYFHAFSCFFHLSPGTTRWFPLGSAGRLKAEEVELVSGTPRPTRGPHAERRVSTFYTWKRESDTTPLEDPEILSCLPLLFFPFCMAKHSPVVSATCRARRAHMCGATRRGF